jgi:FMN-dependent NADH-azoreductase
MKLMHIVASPREEESSTLKVSKAFLEAFQESHPKAVIDELNLFKEKIPELTMKRVDGKYLLLGGKELFGEFKEAWEEIVQHIERFLSADVYLISTPMWNFQIPYKLKQYIDVIVQPRYLFRYTDAGVEGLAKNKKAIVVSSRGGEYASPAMQALDHQEPYLRTIFQFIGITDVTFVKAEPMSGPLDAQKQKILQAQKSAIELARGI